jgi:hypothetical protein
LILDGYIINNGMNKEGTLRKSYYLVSSHVKPLNAKLCGKIFLKEGTML